MLRIQSDSGQSLQLETDPSIEIELSSWLLSDSDELPGSFSYPINFPLSDHNKKFLSHSHLPEAKPREMKVSVWVNGVMLRRATLAYKIERRSCSGFLKVDAGELAAKVKGVYLHEAINERFYIFQADPSDPFNLTNEKKQALIISKMKEIASAAPGQFPVTFFPVYNPEFGPKADELDNYVEHDVVNGWAGGNFLIDQDKKYGRFTVPFIYLTALIERLCTFLGYKATGSFLDSAEVKRWVVYNTQTLFSTNYIGYDGFYADLQMHVPYMTIPDFLRALHDDYGLGIFFNSTTMQTRFELFEDIRSSQKPARDLTAHILKGYDSEMPDSKGYTILSNQDDHDELFKGYESVTTKIKEGQKDIKCQIGTLKMYRGQNSDGKAQNGTQMEWYIPQASQKGNIVQGAFLETDEYYNRTAKHKNDFGLRVLSYHGMQPGSEGKLYPFATSVTRSYNQTRLGQMSHDAGQADSTYNQLTVPFYMFLASCRRLRYELLLPLGQSNNLPFYQVYTLKGENQVSVRFLLERLIINAPGRHGLLPAKAHVSILLPPAANPNRPDFELFYVEMFQENQTDVVNGQRIMTTADLVFRVWKDQAKTVPANPTALPVKYEERTGTTNSTFTADITVPVTGHEHRIVGAPVSDFSPEETTSWLYILLTSSEYIAI